MTKFQAWFVHLSVAVVTATGVVFAWMKYGMTNDDPFSVVNHPWQPFMLAAHVVMAPVLVFGLGWIFSVHILPKYRNGRGRRKSGLSGLWLMGPMILSGYLLQVTTGEWSRQASAFAHWVTSGLFVVAYLIHQWVGRQNEPSNGRPE